MVNAFLLVKIEEQTKLMNKNVNDNFFKYLSSITDLLNKLFDKFNKKSIPQNNLPAVAPKSNFPSQIFKTIKPQHTDKIFSLCFLKNGKLISSGKDGKIVIYNETTFDSETEIQKAHKGSVFSVCGLRNGNLISSGSDGLVKVWEIYEEGYKNIQTLHGHTKPVNKVIELEDGKVCSCSDDKKIRIWENKANYSNIQTLIGHSDYIKSILEMNNSIIFTSINGTDDKSLEIWDKSTYQCMKIIRDIFFYSRNGVSKIKNRIIVLGGKGELITIDILSFNMKSFKNNLLGDIYSIYPLEDMKVLLGNSAGKVIYFDLSSSKIISTNQLHNSPITYLIENEDKKLFSLFWDQTIKVYE